MKDIDRKISIIVKACNDKKGFDIKAIDIRKLTPITDYFVLVSGNSTTQVLSIADEVEEKMIEAGYELLGKEGKESSRWILLDFGDIIVHVFHREDREFYSLDKLWADGDELTLDHML
ncbi:Ribosomal silencing factor RsfS [[Clostridium] ultunense Esp]|uniref:Ribosomal silencing factor RsfS n=1 Tax=[Clostridium] ultunense Esp TaxID=1288971 RepID=M1Z3L8_9FIRM|nr:ribosome silencing factor [Schnuerera ultunensis]CCQ92626.1 Ribosomal silencing factor RsfS [[Clostridium] ultunense Esp]SHD77926.1 ribosomal silencing factor [[Clostridium] ultunense Esp]